MSFLYTLSIRLYYTLVLIVSLFNKKAKLWINGRKKLISRIELETKNVENIIWFHIASLGEFEQARPLIEDIKKNTPNYKILITFFSPSGYEIRKNYNLADFVYYLPIDTKQNAKRFIKAVNPVKVFFVKYEFWANYLKTLKKNNIENYIFSTIFRKNQVFFKWYGGWYRTILNCFNLLFVQNNESVELLKSIGITNTKICGDTRFDRVFEISKESKELKDVEQFKQNKEIIICGSTWEKDEEKIIEFINQNTLDVKFIIAPHEIHSSNIKRIQDSINKKTVLYTDYTKEDLLNASVLIVNCIGKLSSMYKYGDISYIGGGFGVGIHNTLEAATFGLPVIFGPNYKKFQEAKDLIELKGGFTIETSEDLKIIFTKLLTNPNFLKESGNAARNLVVNNCGAAKLIREKTFNL